MLHLIIVESTGESIYANCALVIVQLGGVAFPSVPLVCIETTTDLAMEDVRS